MAGEGCSNETLFDRTGKLGEGLGGVSRIFGGGGEMPPLRAHAVGGVLSSSSCSRCCSSMQLMQLMQDKFDSRILDNGGENQWHGSRRNYGRWG